MITMVTTTPSMMVNAKTLTRLISMATLAMITHSVSPMPPTRTLPMPTRALPMPSIHPLCVSQFALVNHACSSLPTLAPPAPSAAPPPPPPLPGRPLNESNLGFPIRLNHHRKGHHGRHVGHHGSHVGHHHHWHDHERGHDRPEHEHKHRHHHHEDEDEDEDDDEDEHDHEDEDDNEDEHEHRHRHHHKHHHKHEHKNKHKHEPEPKHEHEHEHKQASVVETEAQKECCRWLRAVDHKCVCDLLVYLPVFLSKPAHKYTVVVDEGCQIDYECPGRKFG